MNTTEIIDLAKRGAISHDQVYSELQRFAEEQRQRGQSSDQAFSHFISKTAEGQKLFAAYKSMPGGQFDMTDRLSAAERGVPVEKVADTDWSAMVKLYSKMYGLTEGAATNQMLATPEGMAMFRKQKRIEQKRNPDFTAIHHAQEAAHDAARDEQREFHKRTSMKSRYEEMVAQVRRADPSISELRAGDIVRRSKEGQEAWAAFMRNFRGPDPRAAEISGKPQPARTADWDQHARSDLTPPRKFPVANDAVRFKSAEAQTALANFEFFTKVLFDASAKAGKNWSAEQCVSMLMKCPSARVYMVAACGA
jgi:hypothetical protein